MVRIMSKNYCSQCLQNVTAFSILIMYQIHFCESCINVSAVMFCIMYQIHCCHFLFHVSFSMLSMSALFQLTAVIASCIRYPLHISTSLLLVSASRFHFTAVSVCSMFFIAVNFNVCLMYYVESCQSLHHV